MKSKLWNERTRLMLTLELTLVLPAAALIIASALHLRSIQRDRAVEAAIQRDFSQVLAIGEKQINHKAYELIDDVRSQFPTNPRVCTNTLDKILAAHPYAAHAWVYDPVNGMVLRSQPDRLREASFRSEAEGLSKMYETWMKVAFDDMCKELAKKETHGTPYYFESNWAPRGDKHVYQSVAMFPIKDAQTGRESFGGVVFDAEYL